MRLEDKGYNPSESGHLDGGEQRIMQWTHLARLTEIKVRQAFVNIGSFVYTIPIIC